MPRDASGNYTLPTGNPVVTGTVVSSTWANDTMQDLRDEMQDSLSRSGNGGMLAPIRHVNGTVGAPAISFTSEPLTGAYRAGAGDIRYAIAGVDSFRIRAGILEVWDSTDSAWYVVSTAKTAGGTIETQALASGQTVVPFTANVAGAAFYLNGPDADNGRLELTTDYTYDSVANEVTLLQSYPAGTNLSAIISDESDVTAAAAAAAASAVAAAASEAAAAASEAAAAASEAAAEAAVNDALYNSVALLKAASLTAGTRAETNGYYSAGDGGQAEYLIKTAAQAATDGDVIDGYGNHTLANGNVAILQGDVAYLPQFGGDKLGVSDSTSALASALNSGKIIDGLNGVYSILSNPSISATGAVVLKNTTLNIASGVQIITSSSSLLTLDNVIIDGEWDGLSPVALASSVPALLHQRTDDGEIFTRKLRVVNYNGNAFQFRNVERITAVETRIQDCAYGAAYFSTQSLQVDNYRAKNIRRSGLNIQSDTQVTYNYSDCNINNVSVDTILPGVGTGTDLHGIGIEISNFVDEALLNNIRIRNCHSMGISLSGCERAMVTNLFIKDIGYTSESAAELTRRGYAAIEIVDSDGAFVEANIKDIWQTGVRFDKTHHATVDVFLDQQNSDVNTPNYRFIRFQGTANDLNNSSWSCTVSGEFRNNTSELVEFLDVGTFGTYLNYRHQLINCKVFNAVVDSTSRFSYDGFVIESDGTFDNSTTGTINSLLDLTDAGSDIYLHGVKYIGLDSANKPKAFCNVSTSTINNVKIFDCQLHNIDNIISSAPTTILRSTIDSCLLDNVGALYNHTIAGAFTNQGSSNIQINGSAIAELPSVYHANLSTGVAAPISGDVIWKRGAGTGTSPGWMYDGAVWRTMANVT